MKVLLILALSVSLFLVACGGNSSGFPIVNIESPPEDSGSGAGDQSDTTPETDPPGTDTGVDDADPVTPEPVTSEPAQPVQPAPPTPAGNEGSDDNIPPGELSELFGSVNFAYTFTQTDPLFNFEVSLSAADVQLTSIGTPFLAGLTFLNTRLSAGAEPMVSAAQSFGCTFSPSTGGFFCTLDSGGTGQTLFSITRVQNGRATGTFKFCAQLADQQCVTSVVLAPDGSVIVAVNSEQASATNTVDDNRERTDLTPYLQYLEQGTSREGGA